MLFFVSLFVVFVLFFHIYIHKRIESMENFIINVFHTLQENTCLINGQCHTLNEEKDTNHCKRCDPSLSTSAWSDSDSMYSVHIHLKYFFYHIWISFFFFYSSLISSNAKGCLYLFKFDCVYWECRIEFRTNKSHPWIWNANAFNTLCFRSVRWTKSNPQVHISPLL